MLRCCLLVLVVSLLPLAALAEGEAALDVLSPSFTYATVPPPTGNAGLSGVYHLATVHGYYQPLSRSMVFEVQQQDWCFFTDGRCYYGLPTEGLDNFSYDYATRLRPENCCAYRLAGGDGVITWSDVKKPPTPFQRAKDGLIIGTDTKCFTRLDPCDGLRLSGRFKRNGAEAGSRPEGISFTPDGAFRDEGILRGVQWDFVGHDANPIHDPGLPGRGTYQIAHNSLVLLYDDGRKKRISIHRDFDRAASLDPVESVYLYGVRFGLVK